MQKVKMFAVVLGGVMLLSGCFVERPVPMDRNKIKLIPEAAAKKYLVKFGEEEHDPKVTRMYTCNLSMDKFNHYDYEKVIFSYYDNSMNPMTELTGFKYKLTFNNGCNIASNDKEIIEKVATSLLSLGAKNETLMDDF